MKLFGSTISETQSFLKNRRAGSIKATKDRNVFIARLAITILLIVLSSYLLIYEINRDVPEILLGAIVGYWLK